MIKVAMIVLAIEIRSIMFQKSKKKPDYPDPLTVKAKKSTH